MTLPVTPSSEYAPVHVDDDGIRQIESRVGFVPFPLRVYMCTADERIGWRTLQLVGGHTERVRGGEEQSLT